MPFQTSNRSRFFSKSVAQTSAKIGCNNCSKIQQRVAVYIPEVCSRVKQLKYDARFVAYVLCNLHWVLKFCFRKV